MNYEINSAKFISSVVKITDCPTNKLPEFAFIGRSNVGKSSLINMLTDKKDLAKTSQTPGKTQTINHFLIDNHWYIVDLPGYGYARVSKTQRQKWSKFIQDYLVIREELFCVFVLIDARIPPQKIDLEFINLLGDKLIPFVIIFTKTDDKKFDHKNIENFKQEMLSKWENLPQMFISSAVKKRGKSDILDFIHQIIADAKQ